MGFTDTSTFDASCAYRNSVENMMDNVADTIMKATCYDDHRKAIIRKS